MSDDLERLIYDTLENCGRHKKDVADEMGTSPPKLSREVNPYDDGAKLGVTSLIPFMRATRSLAILDYLADAMGCKLVAKQGAPNGQDLNEEIVQGYESVSAFLIDAKNMTVPFTRLAEKRRKAAKELDDVLDSRSPNYAEALGFICGHVCTPSGMKVVLVPNEEAEAQP